MVPLRDRGVEAKTNMESRPEAKQELATPAQATAVQATTVQATPVQAMPVQAMPVQATPVQATPVQATPVQATTASSELETELDSGLCLRWLTRWCLQRSMAREIDARASVLSGATASTVLQGTTIAPGPTCATELLWMLVTSFPTLGERLQVPAARSTSHRKHSHTSAYSCPHFCV